MTTTPLDQALTLALRHAGMHPTKAAETWVEAATPTRPGPRLHFEIHVKECPGGFFSGERECGEPEPEIIAWLVAKVQESILWPHWRGVTDAGEDRDDGYRKVRPFSGYGWSPSLSRHAAAMTGRGA